MAQKRLRVTVDIYYDDDECSINESYGDDIVDWISDDLDTYYPDGSFDVCLFNTDIYDNEDSDENNSVQTK